MIFKTAFIFILFLSLSACNNTTTETAQGKLVAITSDLGIPCSGYGMFVVALNDSQGGLASQKVNNPSILTSYLGEKIEIIYESYPGICDQGRIISIKRLK